MILDSTTIPVHELPGTIFQPLASPTHGGASQAVWRVTIESGTTPVPHMLTAGEIFVVERGTAAVQVGELSQIASAGDTIIVPADTLFALSVTGSEPFTALVVMPPNGQAYMPGEAPFTPPWAR